MDPVEEIKQKINIVDLISQYVELKKSGINWKGRCPFHNEKTPSFMVNEERQFYYCFGCNQGGDIFNFLQNKENLEFPEVLKILAKKAGVNLPTNDSRLVSQRNRIYDLLDDITNYWSHELQKQSIAKQYLNNRGLDEKTIIRFRLGYAPQSWDQSLLFLKNKGYTETEIFSAGLTVKKEKGSGYYDRFRDRITFPIMDIHDNVIGFSARALSSDVPAKYINSPETVVYKKSHVLYGLHLAKEEIRQKKFVILVEGNMDVIASHRVGITNTVAVSGTALTDEQILLLKRFTDNLAICFDMDVAGQNAARRSIDLALKHEMNIRVIQLSHGKDPDECIKLNPHNWKQAIENAVPIMQYYLEKVLEDYNPQDINSKKKIIKEFLPEINKLVSKIERDHWIKILANKINVDYTVIYQDLPMGAGIQKSIVKNQLSPQAHGLTALDDLLISFIINHPEFLNLVIDQLIPEMIDTTYQKLYRQIIIWYNQNVNISSESLVEKITAMTDLGLNENSLRSLILLVDRDYSDYSLNELQVEVMKVINRLKLNYYQKRSQEIQNQMSMVSAEKINDLIKELQDINNKKNQLKI